MLDRIRLIILVDLDDGIIALFLLLEKLQCLRLIARCNDTVGKLSLDQFGSTDIAEIIHFISRVHLFH